jgi:hypothetical protein
MSAYDPSNAGYNNPATIARLQRRLDVRRSSRLRITRTVTSDECDWLSEDACEGEIVFVFKGATYGTIADGVVVSRAGPYDNPFFEMPLDALAPMDES